MSEPAVSVRGLTRAFGDFVAVDHVDLEVQRGTVFGFLGPNGAGKTTVIRMLCGLLRPTAGEGRVAGFDLRREPEAVKAHLGYMSQKFSLYEDLTVGENVEFFAGAYGLRGARRRARVAWALGWGGLEPYAAERAGALAAGWRQRLALGCALLHEPAILFLDEPTSGVDPSSRRRFWDLITELAEQGATVFVTTHYLDEAEHCDRLALIHAGRLVAEGPPAAIKARAIRGPLLAVACSDPPRAYRALEGLAVVRRATLAGRELRVEVADAERAAPEIRQRLEQAGVRVSRLAPASPSLEDAFVALVTARVEGERDR